MIYTTLFFFKIILAILIPLHFHIHFIIILSISIKFLAGILIVITLDLYIKLERIDIFTMLKLLFHENGLSLHLFRSLKNFSHHSFQHMIFIYVLLHLHLHIFLKKQNAIKIFISLLSRHQIILASMLLYIQCLLLGLFVKFFKIMCLPFRNNIF